MIPLPRFKKRLEIPEEHYRLCKLLRQRVLKPALAALPAMTALRITEHDPYRGRKVIALQFLIHRIPQGLESSRLPAPSEPQALPALVTRLVQAGLSRRDAREVWRQEMEGVDP